MPQMQRELRGTAVPAVDERSEQSSSDSNPSEAIATRSDAAVYQCGDR